MGNSTPLLKPAKPRPDFPLFPHATGRWAKKIRGRLVYFGPWDDPEGAERKYREQAADLHAGRTPGRSSPDGLKLRELVNHFLTAKEQQRDAGDIKHKTFRDYYATCDLVIEAFGKTRLVDDLAAEDFNALRASLAKRFGVHGLSREVQQVRTLFKFGYEAGLLDKPIRFGPTFKRPSKKKIRLHRQRSDQQNGKRMFEAAELRALYYAASQPMKAMILLGINCGFGNNDCSMLPKSALDLDSGWVDYPRPKTAVERRCPLWPETVDALREWQRVQPVARRSEFNHLVFVTRNTGRPWAKDSSDNPVTKEFAKLLGRLGMRRYGLGFYSLRRTFETIGGDARDQVAVDYIMGHADESMAGIYRQDVPDDRLLAVTNYVHAWLFPRPTVGS